MRVIDSTDPLTGLTTLPVLLVRLQDAIRRARRSGNDCALVMVELSNHTDIVAAEGRLMGDRALVVAASQLSAVVRGVDTVCRVSDTRFALLIEAPFRTEKLAALAQHIIAKGLAGADPVPLHLSPRFRVVTLALPDRTASIPAAEESNVEKLLQRLHQALDRLEPKKVIQHLPVPTVGGSPISTPAAAA